MTRIERIAIGAVMLGAASPALATTVPQAPAPIVGAGLGAAVLIGAGYRALKSRIGR